MHRQSNSEEGKNHIKELSFYFLLDLQRYNFYHIRAIFSSLVFVCKRTTIIRNLFARLFNYISSIVNPIWQTSYFASFLLMVDTLPANSEELSFFR